MRGKVAKQLRKEAREASAIDPTQYEVNNLIKRIFGPREKDFHIRGIYDRG
jgi:hypothetical protein